MSSIVKKKLWADRGNSGKLAAKHFLSLEVKLFIIIIQQKCVRWLYSESWMYEIQLVCNTQNNAPCGMLLLWTLCSCQTCDTYLHILIHFFCFCFGFGFGFIKQPLREAVSDCLEVVPYFSVPMINMGSNGLLTPGSCMCEQLQKQQPVPAGMCSWKSTKSSYKSSKCHKNK